MPHRMILFSMDKIHIQDHFLILKNKFNLCGQATVQQYFHGNFFWMVARQFTRDRHIIYCKCSETLEEC